MDEELYYQYGSSSGDQYGDPQGYTAPVETAAETTSGQTNYGMPDDSEMGGSTSGIPSWDKILSGTGTSSDFLSRLFSGTMTSGDKAGTMLGLGALAIAQSLANKPPAIKQPVYKQAPVYNRALTAPMYGMGYLDQKTNKQVGMGMPLFFNPNPFQFDPTEAAKRYGPTPADIAAGQQAYSQRIAELYTPRSVPDVQMTGTTNAATPVGATTGATAAPVTMQPAQQQTEDYKTSANQAAQTGFLDAVKAANPQLDWANYNPNKIAMVTNPYQEAINYYDQYGKGMPATPNDVSSFINFYQGQSSPTAAKTTTQSDSGAIVTGKSGGFLQGRGDGMSDSIPATINDKQPARLADGEFVVPADVVAHLGNGSSKAGAQRLYEMMARVRKARTGTTKQAPEIKADKFV